VGEQLSLDRRRLLIALALILGVAIVVVSPLRAAEHNSYTVVPLVSDQPGVAPNTDPNLVNAWGLTSGPTTPWWVSDNGTDKSTLYRGSDGQPQALVVNVHNAPTGTVFNPTTGFVLPTGGKALFLFDTEEGKVLGWNQAQGTTAVVVANLGDGAIYKGLAIADTSAGPRLYAADFHNARVDVFDGSFNLVPGGFVDRRLPRGYAPFGIQTIGDRVFVSYAKQDAAREDDVPGQGRGFVDAYDTAGHLLDRVAQRGPLNAPWGLALAPDTFGRFAGDLLVGNFGNGKINAYAEEDHGHGHKHGQDHGRGDGHGHDHGHDHGRHHGHGDFEHRGQLRGADGRALRIDGLWALEFGQGGNNGPAGTLFFTAGPDDEMHGLFGQINPS
jgi:uncharacterized protein (TIGR03118 family)